MPQLKKTRLKKQREAMKELRLKRIRDGVCPNCGKRDKGKETLTCDTCAVKDRNKMRQRLGLKVELEAVGG